MLKFIKHHMETIAGIEIFPLISFVIFFLFFLGLLIWVFRTDKEHIRKMAEMPLGGTPLGGTPLGDNSLGDQQNNHHQSVNNHETIER